MAKLTDRNKTKKIKIKDKKTKANEAKDIYISVWFAAFVTEI